jgi:hypothetical protein
MLFDMETQNEIMLHNFERILNVRTDSGLPKFRVSQGPCLEVSKAWEDNSKRRFQKRMVDLQGM